MKGAVLRLLFVGVGDGQMHHVEQFVDAAHEAQVGFWFDVGRAGQMERRVYQIIAEYQGGLQRLGQG